MGFLALAPIFIGVKQLLDRRGGVNHPALGAPIRRYGARALPFVLIALGVFILSEAGTVQLLAAALAS